MEDSYRHKGMRRRLLESLVARGIEDETVLAAINQVPRHLFLDKAFEELAYEDRALPIEQGQTISQPYTVAYQTQLLAVQPKQKILEIGTGSGYQSAVLAAMGARVFTVERHERLYTSAQQLLEQLQIGNVRCFFRDGNKGLGEFAPYDRILVTAGASQVPTALLEQLQIKGYLVIPIGEEGQVQQMQRFCRLSETHYEQEIFDNFRFVPMLTGKTFL